MAKSSILGGMTKSVAADPSQPDQENKGGMPQTQETEEAPVTEVVDPENVNQGEGGPGEHLTNTPNPTNEGGPIDIDEATGIAVPTAKNAYVADPNLDLRADGPVGEAGAEEEAQRIQQVAAAESARQAADETRKALEERRKNRRFQIPSEGEYLAGGEVKPTIVAAYKHLSVRHFKVGPFEFQNHILYITDEASNEAFLDIVDELPPIDQNNIVKYDWEAAERLAAPAKAARGSMSTRDIKDAKTVR